MKHLKNFNEQNQNQNVEIDYNSSEYPVYRDTYAVNILTRSWVPFIIDGQEYLVEIGVEAFGDLDCNIKNVWIENLNGAPEFVLTDDMKTELGDEIMLLPEKY